MPSSKYYLIYHENLTASPDFLQKIINPFVQNILYLLLKLSDTYNIEASFSPFGGKGKLFLCGTPLQL